MKKIITALTILVFFLLPHPSPIAKSYAIDQAQIRGMVYPDGSILMNEIFHIYSGW